MVRIGQKEEPIRVTKIQVEPLEKFPEDAKPERPARHKKFGEKKQVLDPAELEAASPPVTEAQDGPWVLKSVESEAKPLPKKSVVLDPMRMPTEDGTQTTQKRETAWRPYAETWTETPALAPFRRLLPAWYRLRNPLLRSPFCQARFPHIPEHKKVPNFMKGWHRSLTLGELLVMIPMLGFTVAFCVLAMVKEYSVGLTGCVAGYPVIAVFILASRNSLLTFLLGVPFERALFWHKMIGSFVVLSLSWVHGARAIIEFGDEDKKEDFHGVLAVLDHGHRSHHFPAIPPLSGVIIGVIFTAFPLLSFPAFRRRFFTVFYAVHIALVILAVVFSIAHGYGSFLLGVILWLCDLIFRYVYLAIWSAPRKATAMRLPANVVRLSFPQPKGDKRFQYSAGQYVFLMVPELNVFEWHPFTISSAPHHDFVSVHVRVLGNWTKALYDLISKKGGGPVEINAYWEGPYGSPEVDIDSDKYKLFLLISGGIGITPMQSIANSLAYQHEELGRPLKKVWFVWSCADKYMVSANYEHDKRSCDSPPRLPLSFQPDYIGSRIHTDKSLFHRRGKELGDKNLLHTEFYLTKVRAKESQMEGANIRPQLQPFLRFGRPDFAQIFNTYRRFAISEGESRVAVLVCGPDALVQSVRRFCGAESQDGVAFDFHSETFAF